MVMGKKFSSIILVVLSILLIVSCSTIQPIETLSPIVEQATDVGQQPVAEQVPLVEKPEKKPIETHYSYGGYGLDVVLGEGSGYITYPTILKSEDIVSFLSYVGSAYSSYLKDITYSLDGNKINLTYPKSFGGAEATVAQQLFLTAFDSYIKKISTSTTNKAVAVSEPVKVEPVIIVEPENGEIKAHFTYNGYGLDVVLGEGSGYITYPTVLTKGDLASFLSFVQSKYSSYLSGITYSLDGNKINLTYPKSFGGAEASLAEQLFLDAFESYIGMITNPAPEVEEQVVVSETVNQVPETTKEIVSVPTEPAKVQNVTSIVEDKAVEKTTNTALIILLIVIALIVVLAVAYYFFIYKRKKEEN